MPTIDEYIEISRKRTQQILDMEKKLGEQVSTSQAQLWQMLSSDWISRLNLSSTGELIYNNDNIAILNQLDKEWAKFNTLYHNNVIRTYANDLLEITNLSAEYFGVMGFGSSELILKNLGEVRGLLETQLGVKFGKNPFSTTIKAGSYIDKLTQGDEIKKQIRNLVLSQISAGASYADFSKKLNELILGSPEVNGAMIKYYKTFAYDTFSAVQASTDLYMANNLGLNYFIYAGTEIKTTRPFCSERIGQTFSREEAQPWEEMDWAGKNWDSSFFIARGGYNCRHQLDWISDEMAQRLRGETIIATPQPPKPAPKPPEPPKPIKEPGLNSGNIAKFTPAPGTSAYDLLKLFRDYSYTSLKERGYRKEFLQRMEEIGFPVWNTNIPAKLGYAELNQILEASERMSIFGVKDRVEFYSNTGSTTLGSHNPWYHRIKINYGNPTIHTNKPAMEWDNRWVITRGEKFNLIDHSQQAGETIIHEGFHSLHFSKITNETWTWEIWKSIQKNYIDTGVLTDDWAIKRIERQLKRLGEAANSWEKISFQGSDFDMLRMTWRDIMETLSELDPDNKYIWFDYSMADIYEAFAVGGNALVHDANIAPFLKEAIENTLKTIKY